jgi:hypothetical protein
LFDCVFVSQFTITCSNPAGNTVITCDLTSATCVNNGGFTILTCESTGPGTFRCSGPGQFGCDIIIGLAEITVLNCGPG